MTPITSERDKKHPFFKGMSVLKEKQQGLIPVVILFHGVKSLYDNVGNTS